MNVGPKKCLNCGGEFEGRKGKKYCNDYCKSNYHYEQRKLNEDSFYKQVHFQLKLNRKILREYNKAGKSTVRREVLLKEGFDPNFFTHYWKNKKGEVYLFCYEFGFMRLPFDSAQGDGVRRFILVKWQRYMGR